MAITQHRGRTFDYVPRLDPRSNRFLVRDHLAAGATDEELAATSKWWEPGVTLDQGQEGTCVGHGVTGEWLASPVRGKPIVGPGEYPADAGHRIALKVFDWAALHDEYAGNSRDDGTSVNAGLKSGRQLGWWDSFYWAKSLADLRRGLEVGPAVIGVDWYDGMFDPDGSGFVHPTGANVGGHCILVTGYSAYSRSWRFKNSWGDSWGQHGSAFIRSADLDKVLFQAGGECGFPINRHYGLQ